jgi:hypothetical protein
MPMDPPTITITVGDDSLATIADVRRIVREEIQAAQVELIRRSRERL